MVAVEWGLENGGMGWGTLHLEEEKKHFCYPYPWDTNSLKENLCKKLEKGPTAPPPTVKA